MLKALYAKFYHQNTKKVALSKISNGKIFGIVLQCSWIVNFFFFLFFLSFSLSPMFKSINLLLQTLSFWFRKGEAQPNHQPTQYPQKFTQLKSNQIPNQSPCIYVQNQNPNCKKFLYALRLPLSHSGLPRRSHHKPLPNLPYTHYPIYLCNVTLVYKPSLSRSHNSQSEPKLSIPPPNHIPHPHIPTVSNRTPTLFPCFVHEVSDLVAWT